jgi:hypothetical protein
LTPTDLTKIKIFVVNPQTLHSGSSIQLTQVLVDKNACIFPCLHQKREKQGKKIGKLVQTEKDVKKKLVSTIVCSATLPLEKWAVLLFFKKRLSLKPAGHRVRSSTQMHASRFCGKRLRLLLFAPKNAKTK